MRYTRISADCHIDMPWMPLTCSPRMPRGLEGAHAVRDRWARRAALDLQERHVVRPGLRRRPGRREAGAGSKLSLDKMAATGLYEDAKRGIRRVIDPHLRVKDAELDGVDAEVIFGILGAARGSTITTPRKRCSVSTTTGSWTSAVRTRTVTSAWPACPTGDIDAAVKEITGSPRWG